MSHRRLRPRLSSFFALLMAGALAGVFFLPWVRLGCAPRGERMLRELTAAYDAPELEAETNDWQDVAEATGYELARGEIRGLNEFEHYSAVLPGLEDEAPSRRPWVYLGLVLPALAGLIALLNLFNSLSLDISGKLLSLVAVAGIIFMGLICTTDYTEDVFSVLRAETPNPNTARARFARDRDLNAVQSEVRKVVRTRPTWNVPIAIGLYAGVFAMGMVMLAGSDMNVPEEYLADAARYGTGPPDRLGSFPLPSSLCQPSGPRAPTPGLPTSARVGPDALGPTLDTDEGATDDPA